jgi:hypothetical protein
VNGYRVSEQTTDPQQTRRHRHAACLLPFAVADSQLHPLTVDVEAESFQFSVFQYFSRQQTQLVDSGSEQRKRVRSSER